MHSLLRDLETILLLRILIGYFVFITILNINYFIFICLKKFKIHSSHRIDERNIRRQIENAAILYSLGLLIFESSYLTMVNSFSRNYCHFCDR